jgi:hypothetical protein
VVGELGEPSMESDRRFYARRAAQEKLAAARAMTAKGRAWHDQLAEDFMRKVQELTELSPAE